MENIDIIFLSEIKNSLTDLREQIEILENKIAVYEQSINNKTNTQNTPIDLNIEDEVVEDLPKEPFEDLPEDSTEDSAEDLPEDLPEDLTENLPEDSTEESSEDLREAMIDTYADKQAWRRDMPGSTVKDIRSAISLNDRILFINTLFDEDPLKFQETVSKINTMDTLQEVLELVEQDFPKWNLNSDVIYRFMMAVRRRVK